MSTPVFPQAVTNTRPWGRGLLWDVEKTPMFSTAEQVTVTGRRAAIANYATPLWHWKLKFSLLRDRMDLDRNSAKSGRYTAFQEIVGFLLARRGKYDPFFWHDPTDCHVTNQTISASAPASTTDYQVVRTFGNGAGLTFTEPVGGIDPGGTLTITDGGSPRSDFTINTPYDGWIRFASAPTTGHAIVATALDYVFKVVVAKDGTAWPTFAKDYWENLDLELDQVRP